MVRSARFRRASRCHAVKVQARRRRPMRVRSRCYHAVKEGTRVDSVRMEEMTSPAVAEAIRTGRTTAIVACGAVEQHGPHLPLFMDAEHGEVLASEVARRLGNALVAPPIRVGCSEHHMAFAGTVSLRATTFEAVCFDYTASLARHGFRNLCFLPSHGGNFGPLRSMLPSLNDAVAPNARVYAFTDLNAQIELWRRVIEAEAKLGARVGGHADIAEGSIMLALHPRLVDDAAAAEGFRGALTPDVLKRMFAEGIGVIAPNGILGDARGATASLGRACIDATADMLAEYFRQCMATSPAVGTA
jgi:creatinine amidohydrolase